MRQPAEAVGSVESVADQELVAAREADEVGIELGATASFLPNAPTSPA
jgi:hypothetical protein